MKTMFKKAVMILLCFSFSLSLFSEPDSLNLTNSDVQNWLKNLQPIVEEVNELKAYTYFFGIGQITAPDTQKDDVIKILHKYGIRGANCIEKFNMMALGSFVISLEKGILKEINAKDYSLLRSYSKDVAENYEKLNPSYAALQQLQQEWNKAFKELEDIDWNTELEQALKELEDIDWSFNEPTGSSTKATKVGISLPTKILQRWNQDGANMKSQLEKLGYQVNLWFADNDIDTQISQIKDMINNNCKVLIIAPIDGTVLKNVLESAKKKNIPVISYDRLIMNSDAVSYYVTFDNYKVGTTQGDYLVEKLGLKRRLASNPVYMEFFTGDLRDNNINFYFGGAMDVLKPYIDNGVIVCPSKQTTKSQCATSDWSTEEAQKRMENLIKANGYGPKGKKLDAVYCSNDSIANGVTNALISAGYDASNFPIITGQDCDIPSVKNIFKGFQSMSVFKDTHTLASKTVEMADAIMRGSHPYINDTITYDNGAGIIPSYLCEPLFVTKENYKSLLIDSGYYTEEQLKK